MLQERQAAPGPVRCYAWEIRILLLLPRQTSNRWCTPGEEGGQERRTQFWCTGGELQYFCSRLECSQTLPPCPGSPVCPVCSTAVLIVSTFMYAGKLRVKQGTGPRQSHWCWACSGETRSESGLNCVAPPRFIMTERVKEER